MTNNAYAKNSGDGLLCSILSKRYSVEHPHLNLFIYFKMKHRNDFPLTVSFINTPIIILLYA